MFCLDVHDFLLHLVSHHLFLFMVQIVFLSWSLFLDTHAQIIGVFYVYLLQFLIVNDFGIASYPFEVLYLFLDLLHHLGSGKVFLDPSIRGGFSNIIANFCPSVDFLFVDDDKCLSFSAGSGSTTCSMHVGISIHGNSDLDDVGDLEIKSARCHVGGDENVEKSRFFEFLQFF